MSRPTTPRSVAREEDQNYVRNAVVGSAVTAVAVALTPLALVHVVPVVATVALVGGAVRKDKGDYLEGVLATTVDQFVWVGDWSTRAGKAVRDWVSRMG